MIATAIANYIKESGIRQSLLCKQTGLTKYLISQSLHGKRRLSIEEYVTICSALDVPYAFFFEQQHKVCKGIGEQEGR